MNSILLTASAYDLFSVIAVLILFFIVAIVFLIFFMRVLGRVSMMFVKENRYDVFEIGALRKLANKVGIDLSEEFSRIDIEGGRTFRSKIEEKMYKELFEEEE